MMTFLTTPRIAGCPPIKILQDCQVEEDATLCLGHLYEASGAIVANLIVGGIDPDTHIPRVAAIHLYGSVEQHLPYAAFGSGGLAAMAVLESRYHSNMTLPEAIQLVKEAIRSGIWNDLGSGSQVDMCVLSVQNSDRVVSNYIRAALPEEQLVDHPNQPTLFPANLPEK
jgi:20S proteasome subunit beta 2